MTAVFTGFSLLGGWMIAMAEAHERGGRLNQI